MKNNLLIFEHKERAVVSSRTVAADFGKMHRNILASVKALIRGLLKNKQTPSDYFIRSSFVEPQNGQTYPEYLCTRDGFTLLVMGFSGDEALAWKVKYISAFNRMESFINERRSTEWLLTRKQGKLVRRSETDAIAALIGYAKAQGSKNADKMYLTYSKLVNSLVGIGPGQRDSVPFKTISVIMFLEDMILHTVAREMENGTHYKEIYRICKTNGEEIMRFAYLPEMIA